MKFFKSIKRFCLHVKEKINNKNWLLDAVLATSIFTIFLSIFSFHLSNLSSEANSNLVIKNAEVFQFYGADSSLYAGYNGITLKHALYSYYLAVDEPISTTTLFNLDAKKYNQITSSSTEEIEAKLTSLTLIKNGFEKLNTSAFTFLILVQVLNIWFAYRLEKINEIKNK